MSFDPESEFYSEGTARISHASQKKSFWLITGAVVFLMIVVVAVNLMPIQNQQRHLAHLRSQGAVIYSVVKPGVWTSFAEYVQRYSDYRLPTLEEVRQIHFQNFPVDDATIAGLSNYPALQAMSIQSTDVSPNVLENLFPKLPDLTGLTIINCKNITPEWIEQTRQAHPAMAINYRGPAYLGISANIMSPLEEGCVVNYVQPGSAAEKAGLIPGDVIVGVEDSKINSFTELVMKLAEFKPADQINILVSRQQEEILMTCLLSAWSRNEL